MIGESELLGLIGGLRRHDLEAWIERRWVLPERSGGCYVFTELDVARVRLIRDLRHDMQVNEDAVPVVLELLDQLYAVRGELDALRDAVHAQPRDVRDAIAEALRHRLRGGA